MKLGQTRWTSHASYTGRISCPDWLHTETLLEELGGREQYRRYIRSVQLGRRPAPDDFEQVLFKRRRSSEFLMVKQEEHGSELTAEEAIEQVLQITSASKRELKQSKRGREGNPARRHRHHEAQPDAGRQGQPNRSDLFEKCRR